MENFNERPNREIEYTPDFKEVIAQNPGALRSFLKLEKEIEENSVEILDSLEEKVFEDENVKVTPLYSVIKNRNKYTVVNGRDKIPANSFCKVEIGDQVYFVKAVPGYLINPEKSTGVEEFKTINKAKEALRCLENVEIVEPKLGYSDKNTNRTYFVSEWKNLPTIFKSMRETGDPKKADELRERSDYIYTVLKDIGIVEVHTGNMFYDESTDKIYVFDVFEG
jgi:hypothetical protein